METTAVNNVNKESFLSADDNNAAVILLVEKACEQYQHCFYKKNVPLSYIKFFMFEFKKYKSSFKDKLQTFYAQYKKNKITALDMARIYDDSYYGQSDGISENKKGAYLVFNHNISTLFSNEMRGVTNASISDFVENILNICKKIDLSKENVSFKQLYEDFLIEEYIFDNDFSAIPEKVAKKDEDDEPKTEDSTSSELVGDAIEDNYQSGGKITKIIIPKIPLPSEYPVDMNKPRINKSKVASRFVSPAKQIIFINKNKIIGIKYHKVFIESRKTAPKRSSSKFNWDF